MPPVSGLGNGPRPKTRADIDRLGWRFSSVSNRVVSWDFQALPRRESVGALCRIITHHAIGQPFSMPDPSYDDADEDAKDRASFYVDSPRMTRTIRYRNGLASSTRWTTALRCIGRDAVPSPCIHQYIRIYGIASRESPSTRYASTGDDRKLSRTSQCHHNVPIYTSITINA